MPDESTYECPIINSHFVFLYELVIALNKVKIL